jgi:hypothetical protein
MRYKVYGYYFLQGFQATAQVVVDVKYEEDLWAYDGPDGEVSNSEDWNNNISGD